MAKDKQASLATLAQEESSKKNVVIPKVAPIRSSITETPRAKASTAMPFGRQNYTLMLIGIGVILAGFFIMSLDKEEFGFGFLGITLGPIVVMSGFLLEFWAILTKPKA